MKKILVIAEKPSVAKDYAEALNQFNKQDGYYEGDRYIITWSFGHIVSRKELYEYDNNINRRHDNKDYVLKNVPYFPKEHILKLSLINTEFMKNKEQIDNANRTNKGLLEREKTLKYLFNRNDIDFIVNGCDAGREGEAIFCQIYDYLKCTLPAKRLWISSNTKKDILDGFNKLQDASKFKNLKDASYARAEADWEHGLNLSVLYSSLFSAPLPIGRVQTPVVNLIAKRDAEILNFKPENFFNITADFTTMDNFKYNGKLIFTEHLKSVCNGDKIKDISIANQIANSCSKKQALIESIEYQKHKESPKLLFSITELQKEMNKKYKLTAQQTLTIAQSLYEKHKITSYPRTNSCYLNESMKDTVYERLDSLPNSFYKEISEAKKQNTLFKKIFNDKEVEDHYGIIPTENAKNYDLSKLSDIERKVFDSIVLRFLGIFCKDFEYNSTTIITNIEQYHFKTIGKKVTEFGWKHLLGKVEDDDKKEDVEQDLTYNFKEHMEVLCDKITQIAKKTNPPKKYTEGTLLRAMELGGNDNDNIQDPAILKALKEKGLGTGATRAGIIEKIIQDGYIDRVKNYLVATEKGKSLMEHMSVDILKSPEITGDLEYKLSQVEKGMLSKNDFTNQMREFIKQCITLTKQNFKQGAIIKGSGSNLTNEICPICKNPISQSKDFYICAGRNNGCQIFVPKKIGGQTFKESDLKDLCLNGETRFFKNLKSKKVDSNGQPTKYEAKFILNKELGKIEMKFPEKNTERKETSFKCPNCGGKIFAYEKHYGCENFKNNCRFSIYKAIGDKVLSETFISNYLATGTSDILKGLVNPKFPTRKYNIKLTLIDGKTNILYVNEQGETIENISKETKYSCPCCKKQIIDRGFAYQCSNSNCMLKLPKKLCNTELSLSDIEKFFVTKSTDFIEFTNKENKLFRAKLILDKKTKGFKFSFK